MKVIPAHDFTPIQPQPNIKALNRIMTALFVAAALCLAVCMILIARDARIQRDQRPRVDSSICMCCCARPGHPTKQDRGLRAKNYGTATHRYQ
jgi:hypothetical protein